MEPAPASKTLIYSPRQIFAAAFLGGPLAGAWVLSRNYARETHYRQRRLALAVGVVATLAILPIAFYVSDKLPHYIGPLLIGFCFYYFAAPRFVESTEPPVAFYRGWRTWLKILVVVICSIAIMFVLMFALYIIYGLLFPSPLPRTLA